MLLTYGALVEQSLMSITAARGEALSDERYETVDILIK